MAFAVREGVSWCLCSGRAVFLDVERDRYFALTPKEDAAFQLWARAEQAIDDPGLVSRLVAAGVLREGNSGAEPAKAASAPVPMTDLAIDGRAPARVSDIALALVAQHRAAVSLRRQRLADILRRLASDRARAARTARDAEDRVRRVAAAFASTPLSFRKLDRCLPRALAARTLCGGAGVFPTIVFGVRLEPFAAHCWVQWGDAVVVGDLEEARMFTPILAVS